MESLKQRLDRAADCLRDTLGAAPPVALITGSGFSFLERDLEDAKGMAYGDVPHFIPCSNPAHPGKLLVGSFKGSPLAILLGRLHGYEGLSPKDVVFNLRAVAHWGVKNFILTNAAGGINMQFRVGDLMVISDHINLLGSNPLTGPNDDAIGPRFPDMTQAWDPTFMETAQSCAKKEGFTLHAGTYAALPGPVYETPAEIKMLRLLGADVVGMSTVPEVIALRHMGKRVFGLSCVTNAAAGDGDGPITDDEVREVLQREGVQVRARSVLNAIVSSCQ